MKANEREALLETLRTRFEQNMVRHPKLRWDEVESKLASQPKLDQVILAMELSGGEPDIVIFDKGRMVFCDCAGESPSGRRSLCYDGAALKSRKENKPKGSALEMASELGIQILNEALYRQLQSLGSFDCKTSSWVETPSEVRKLGGALFCDRRYEKVFVYHNGAESYYAARGFRGYIEV